MFTDTVFFLAITIEFIFFPDKNILTDFPGANTLTKHS